MALVATGMTKGRGTGKMLAADAAQAPLKGIEDGRDEVWVGKTQLLRAIERISPPLAHRLLRNG
ncbi:hypothetical protein [Methylocapsa acidiphila]|uniref:hypothetical protein n=1 Tax=Methylocapsa acidiphila TaxID=133552 RepID=UPI0018DBD802|nr:hypothetical protein [Methylocapsa acidiphila]